MDEQTYPEVEEVGNLYTYVEPILESELKPGPVEANMYKRFLRYVEIGTQIREKGQKIPGLFYGETDLGKKTIVLPRRLIQRHFSQNETSQSKDELGGGKKTRRHRRKTTRRKHKKRYSRKY